MRTPFICALLVTTLSGATKLAAQSPSATGPVIGPVMDEAGLDESVAVLGDSLSTGAATHPALRLDGPTLWSVLRGFTEVAPHAADVPDAANFHLKDPLQPPLRLEAGPREYEGALSWAYHSFWQGLSALYLDTEEYSWPYLVAKREGVAPSHLLLAAEDGAKVEMASRQADRVLDRLNGRLPARTYVFFTGNDLCAPTLSLMTSPEAFEASLREALDYLGRNGTPAPHGSEIIVIGYLDVAQLLYEKPILAKKVYAYGRDMSCQDVRSLKATPTQTVAISDLGGDKSLGNAQVVLPGFPARPSDYCPSLFANDDDTSASDRVTEVANRVRAYRKAAENAVDKARADLSHAGKHLSLRYEEGPSRLRFGAEDIAGDCFHLSAKGQASLAKTLLEKTP